MPCKHGEDNCARCAFDEVKVPPIQVYFILDTSSSMQMTWPQTIEGINEYFTSLRSKHGQGDIQYRISLITFDTDVTTLLDQVLPDSIPTFSQQTLQANGGSTSLFDAVGKTTESIKTDDPALVVIFTDGHENSSRTWDSEKVSKLIEAKEKEGNYTFVYMGVDKAAWNNSSSLGLRNHKNNANFAGTVQGRQAAFSSLSANSLSYSGSVVESYKGAVSIGASGKLASNSKTFFGDDEATTSTSPAVPQADGGDSDLV